MKKSIAIMMIAAALAVAGCSSEPMDNVHTGCTAEALAAKANWVVGGTGRNQAWGNLESCTLRYGLTGCRIGFVSSDIRGCSKI